jgi:uncharacterized protein YoxC
MHDSQTLQMILTEVAVGALAIQTIFMLVLVVIAVWALKKMRDEMEHYRSVVKPIVEKVTPIIDKTREVVDNVAPKVQEVSEQLTTITRSLREQTTDIQIAATDIIDRTRRQATRVDNVMTSVMNRVEKAGELVSDAVAKPMRQLSGLIASIKAALESLREQAPASQPPPRRAVSTARFGDGEQVPGPRPTGTVTQFHP